MKIEAAHAGDMPACAEILNAWIDDTDWLPRVHSHANISQNYATLWQRRAMCVARSGYDVLGFSALDAEDACVTALYVQATHRKCGIGAALLDHLKATNPSGLALWAYALNTDACRFYEHNGFVLIPGTEETSDEGLTEVEYRWALNRSV